MRRRIALLSPALIAFGWQAAQSQSAEAVRPTRMIVPGGPGTSPDLAARFVADGLSRRRGHPIAVENRPGADGILAMEAFVAARPGEALFAAYFAALTVTPLLHERLSFDPVADFVPIARTAVDFLALCVPAALPVRSAGDFVAYARARNGALNWFAPPGSPYLAFRQFLRDARLEMPYVSYRAGTAALLDLAAGRIQAVLTPLAPALGPARDGGIRILASAGRVRAPALPEIPTTTEAGVPELQVEGGHGLFGWRGMPETLRDELSLQAQAVVADPVVAERFSTAGLLASGASAARFAGELAEYRARWATLAREFGVRPPG